jgi:hypothetical protein
VAPVASAPPGNAASANEAEATSGCRECGKPLVDPFDQALGICDTCRERGENPMKGSRSGAPQIEPPPPAFGTASL